MASTVHTASLPARMQATGERSRRLVRSMSEPPPFTGSRKGYWGFESLQLESLLPTSLHNVLLQPTTINSLVSGSQPTVQPISPTAVPGVAEVMASPSETWVEAEAGKVYSIDEIFPAAPTLLRTNLTEIEYLAEGAWGDIYTAKQTRPKRSLIIKHFQRGKASARHENEMLRLVHEHQSVVDWLGFYVEGRQSWLLEEGLETTVSQWRTSLGIAPVDMAKVRSIIRDILLAVEFFQSKRILHLDIKGDNVGLDHLGQAKIFDFGVALALPSDADVDESWDGTAGLMPPEHANESRVNLKTDTFTSGMLLHFMISGRVITLDIDKYTPKEQVKTIFQEWTAHLWRTLGRGAQVANFLFDDLLAYEVEDRKGFPDIWISFASWSDNEKRKAESSKNLDERTPKRHRK